MTTPLMTCWRCGTDWLDLDQARATQDTAWAPTWYPGGYCPNCDENPND